MTYWQRHYHLIWSTHNRQPILTGEREKVFYSVLHHKAEERELKLHDVGNVGDQDRCIYSIEIVSSRMRTAGEGR